MLGYLRTREGPVRVIGNITNAGITPSVTNSLSSLPCCEPMDVGYPGSTPGLGISLGLPPICSAEAFRQPQLARSILFCRSMAEGYLPAIMGRTPRAAWQLTGRSLPWAERRGLSRHDDIHADQLAHGASR